MSKMNQMLKARTAKRKQNLESSYRTRQQEMKEKREREERKKNPEPTVRDERYVLVSTRNNVNKKEKIPLTKWQKMEPPERRKYVIHYGDEPNNHYQLSSHPRAGRGRPTRVIRSL